MNAEIIQCKSPKQIEDPSRIIGCLYTEWSLIVPDFTISGSSCNSLIFGLSLSSFLLNPFLGIPSCLRDTVKYKEKAKEPEWGRTTDNYMNCYMYSEIVNSGTITLPQGSWGIAGSRRKCAEKYLGDTMFTRSPWIRSLYCILTHLLYYDCLRIFNRV